MKITKCCGAKLYQDERVPEEEYNYGVPRPVLCCSNCGTEMPDMVEESDYEDHMAYMGQKEAEDTAFELEV